jgi:hypothetical protein
VTTVAEVIRRTQFAVLLDPVADSWLTAGCPQCGEEHVLSDMASAENPDTGFTAYLCPRTDKPCVRVADAGRYAGDIGGWSAITDGHTQVFAVSAPGGLWIRRPGSQESPSVLVSSQPTTPSDAPSA